LHEGTEPAPDSMLLALQLQPGDVKTEVAVQGMSHCVEACAIVTVDVVFFVLGMLGLHISCEEKISRAILRELGEDTLHGFAGNVALVKPMELSTKLEPFSLS